MQQATRSSRLQLTELGKRIREERRRRDLSLEELAEKARSLYKVTDGAALAALVWEAMLLALAAHTTETKGDLLTEAAKLYKVDVKALRSATLSAGKEKEQKKIAKLQKGESSRKPKTARK